MSRYIDADSLAYMVASNGDADFINKVTKLMIEAPSIDIVRCEKCKHYDTDMWADKETYWCGRASDWGNCKYVKPDDFCSYGERSTDESAL